MLCSWIQLIVIALLCVILYIYTKAYMALITLIILSFLVFTSGVALLWVRRKMQVTLTSGWPAYKGETGKILLKVQNTDRKSTRLNSSHVSISYAVFCLKKKN